MKEFIDNLYKQCASDRESYAIDATFDVFPKLFREHKFEVVDSILKNIDLSKLASGVMYTLVWATANYINALSEYQNFYLRVREEYARRGESSEKISKLFDSYKNGGKNLYDPNKPKYISPDTRDELLLDEKIAWAAEHDSDIEFYLKCYKSGQLSGEDRNKKFRQLRLTIGDEELRKRTVASLREMADLLEENANGWPGIYYCSLPKSNSLMKHTISSIEVIISYPWPG